MKIQILDKAKKKKLLPRLECFGIKKIPQLLVKGGNERVCAYSGSLSVEEIMDLWRILPFEKVGLYIGKEVSKNPHDGDFRLSLDGLHIWKDQINNQIFVLTEEQEEEWFKGKNIELNDEEKAVIEQLFLISGKPVLYAANIDESDIGKDINDIPSIKELLDYACKFRFL